MMSPPESSIKRDDAAPACGLGPAFAAASSGPVPKRLSYKRMMEDVKAPTGDRTDDPSFKARGLGGGIVPKLRDRL